MDINLIPLELLLEEIEDRSELKKWMGYNKVIAHHLRRSTLSIFIIKTGDIGNQQQLWIRHILSQNILKIICPGYRYIGNQRQLTGQRPQGRQGNGRVLDLSTHTPVLLLPFPLKLN